MTPHNSVLSHFLAEGAWFLWHNALGLLPVLGGQGAL